MRGFVTGGAGFIGSHLCDLLLAKGWEVEAYDDLSTGRYKNIKHLENNPRFRFLKAGRDAHLDIFGGVFWADVVFHLASPVGVERVFRNARHTLQDMTHLNEVVFKAASYSGRRVFYASSSEVRELGGPDTGRACYGVGKAYGEALGYTYYYEGTMPFCIGQFYNISGPRQSADFVIPRFIQQAIAGKPLTVYGTGEQSRCFCHVKDAVGAIYLAATEGGALGEILPIGRAEEVTMLELAWRVRGYVGGNSEVKLVPYDDIPIADFHEPQRRAPDMTLTEKILGWEAKRDLNDIIADTFAAMTGKDAEKGEEA